MEEIQLTEKDTKGVVCRLFFDSAITDIPEVQHRLATTFSVDIKCKTYYKFDGWYEMSFYVPFQANQNEALDQVLEKIGGDWMTVYGEHEADYSGYAVWNPEMGGALCFPDLQFGDVSVYLQERQLTAQSIKMMLDYDCWPLWTKDGDNCSPHHLPISTQLQAQLVSWSDKYDALLNRDDPMNSYHSLETDRSLEKEGLMLWVNLQSELGDLWKVAYYSISKANLYETFESYTSSNDQINLTRNPHVQ